MFFHAVQQPADHIEWLTIWTKALLVGVTFCFTQKKKVTNTLMPRILFCLRSTHGTCVADDTHHTPYWHLNIYPAVPPRLAARGRRNVSSDCSQEVTACSTSASFANHLSVCCVLRDPKRWKLPAPVVYGVVAAAAARLLPASRAG